MEGGRWVYEQIIQSLYSMLRSMSCFGRQWGATEGHKQGKAMIGFPCEKEFYSSIVENELDEDKSEDRKIRPPAMICLALIWRNFAICLLFLVEM